MTNITNAIVKLLQDTGNLPALLLIAAVLGLAAVIIVLWKKISDLSKENSDLHVRHEEVLREMMERADDYAEEKTALLREVNNVITALVSIAPNIGGRNP